MNVRITPAPLSGEIAAISSKSDAHRLLILAALSDGTTRIRLNQRSDDIDATVGCLRAMGNKIPVHGLPEAVWSLPGSRLRQGIRSSCRLSRIPLLHQAALRMSGGV